MVTVLSWLYTIVLSQKKIAGKNIKAIISKKIERSGESDTDETAIESVNNANCSMVENDILDENQDVIIIFI